MRYWRMAFKVGNQGTSLWPECEKYGVAAITYYPLTNCDFKKYPFAKFTDKWNELSPAQKGSMKKIIYEMMPNDVIYVKDGSKIICKGTIISSYFFDYDKRIIDENGEPWPHQVNVLWQKEFFHFPLNINTGQNTIVELCDDKLDTILEEENRINEGINDLKKESYYEGYKININTDYIIRNRELIKQKKHNSDYKCEVCGFSFIEHYGDIGLNFIEGHHLKGITHGERQSCLDDIALLCSNCHSMIHRKNPPYEIDELRNKLL